MIPVPTNRLMSVVMKYEAYDTSNVQPLKKHGLFSLRESKKHYQLGGKRFLNDSQRLRKRFNVLFYRALPQKNLV